MASLLEYLQGRGQVFTVIPHSGTRAGDGRVRASGIRGEAVARTVVVIANGEPALLVVPAAGILDLALAAEAVGDPAVRLATDLELERRFPDYEPGTLPPLSMLLLVPTYVDPAVVEHRDVVFAAGRSDISIKMATRDLFGNDPIVVAPLTSESRVPATT
jgi:Ala-tRNA(Pro) deacylase